MACIVSQTNKQKTEQNKKTQTFYYIKYAKTESPAASHTKQ